MLTKFEFLGGQVKRLLRDESGATAIEYGLIAALIALAIIGGASALGDSIGNMFNNVAGTLNNNSPS